MKPNKLFLSAVAIALLAIDQATKYFAYHGNFGSFLFALKPVLSKQLFPNYNFAFSLKVLELWMYLIYIVLLILLFFWFYKVKEKTTLIRFGVLLIFVGALSNILDRVMLGYVRDFIYIFWGNIFNFADVYIVLGILLLIF